MLKLTNENFTIDNSNQDHCILNIEDTNRKSSYRTKLLIGCDGAKSLVRRKMKFQSRGFYFSESILTCNLSLNAPSEILLHRFIHDGIISIYPLASSNDQYNCSVMCSMPSHVNQMILNLSEEEFINFINSVLESPSTVSLTRPNETINTHRFTNVPNAIGLSSKRVVYPLDLQVVDDCVSNNIVLLGDAAHTIHPIATQDLNLGIAGCALLANSLVENLSLGKSLNDKKNLRDFSKSVNWNVRSMTAILEAVKMLYKTRNDIFNGIRHYGLGFVNNSTLLKGIMVDYVNGKYILPRKYIWEKI